MLKKILPLILLLIITNSFADHIEATVRTRDMQARVNTNANITSYHHIVIKNESNVTQEYRYFFLLNYVTGENIYSNGFTVNVQPNKTFVDTKFLSATVYVTKKGSFPIHADTIVAGQSIVHNESKSILKVN